MKKILAVLFCLSFGLFLNETFAQDTIVLKTGEEIRAEIKEVSKYEIKYKKISFQEGPLFTVPSSDIFMIKYSNGEKEVFNQRQTSQSFSRKEPALSCLFSLLLPGGGQYYNGEYKKGALMTGIWAGSLIGMMACAVNSYDEYDYHNDNYYYDYDDGEEAGFILFTMIYLGNYIWSMIDAPVSAGKINQRNMLSWNIGDKARLTLKPDLGIQSYHVGSFRSLEPTYGAKVCVNFH